MIGFAKAMCEKQKQVAIDEFEHMGEREKISQKTIKKLIENTDNVCG